MSTLKKPLRRKVIQNSDPGKILDLVMTLTDEKSAELQIKVNSYLCEECEAEFAFQILVQAERGEAAIDAVGITILPMKQKFKLTPNIEKVLQSNCEKLEYMNNLDAPVRNIVEKFLPNENPKRRVVMLPLLDKPFQVIFCVVAPKAQESDVDVLVYECSIFIWPTVKKTLIMEYEATLKKRCQVLLRAARRLCSKVATLEHLLETTKDQAVELLKAEFCRIMLIDVGKMELYEVCQKNEDSRFPMDIGIVGSVVKSGSLVNLNNVKEHPDYDERVDGMPEKEIRNLLCFPIREQAGIIGVLQVLNKKLDPYFDAMDEEMALAFSIYSGVCITQSVNYNKLHEALIRNALANELNMYHMKVSDHEVTRILECTGFHGHPNLNSLFFSLTALPLRELPCYVCKMFRDLGFDKRFKIKPQTLAAFILHVRKGYRDVPYHGWTHAFSTTQWVYAVLTNYRLISSGYLSDLQGLMFFIAALVHDLDHRGSSSSFQINGETNLAALFTSEGSVMERHHLSQALAILNTEGCDILESLPRKDYDRALIFLRDFILATDLTTFVKNMNDYKTIAKDFQKGNRLHSSTLCALLMIAADHSDQIKDWNNIKKTSAALMTEYLKQGNLDKAQEFPDASIDQGKYSIPELMIEYLDSICIPLFEIIRTIIPKMEDCVTILEGYVEKWDGAKPVFAEIQATTGIAVLLSPELDNLIELSVRERELEREREAERAAAEAEPGE